MEIYDKNLDVFWYIFFILINHRKDKFYADQKWKRFGHLEGSCEGEYSGPYPCLFCSVSIVGFQQVVVCRVLCTHLYQNTSARWSSQEYLFWKRFQNLQESTLAEVIFYEVAGLPEHP